MDIKSKIKDMLAAWELDVGITPWVIAIAAIVCWCIWADALMSLQIDAHVPPNYPGFFLGEGTARFIVKAAVFISGGFLVYSICAVVDAGWTKKTACMLTLMLAAGSFYMGWYVHPDSSLNRSFERAYRAWEGVEFIKDEIQFRRTEEVKAHYRKMLPDAQVHLDSLKAAYWHEQSIRNTSSNHATMILSATGTVLLIVAVILGTGALLSKDPEPVTPPIDVHISRGWIHTRTFGRTIYVIVSLVMLVFILGIGLAAIGFVPWMLGLLPIGGS